MKHTPGPWTAVIADGKRGGLGIWEVKSVPDLDFAHRSVVSEKAALDEADARLIAAAPAMLEALKKLVEDLHETDEWKRTEAAGAEVAIAIAEGAALFSGAFKVRREQ